MNLKDKIVLAHKGYFNAESKKHYRENSKQVCQISSLKDYITIIELDLRKSKDGTLYCYHGNFIEYNVIFKFPRNFNIIKGKYNVNTLAEILEVITRDKILLLDLKDKSITKADILNALQGKKFKEVILGNTSISISFLNRFSNMPEGFVKIMNGNIFSNFYNLQKLKRRGYKYVEVVFPFQVRKRIIDKVLNNGLEFSFPGLFFFSKESYWRKINKYNIKRINSDFV